MSIPSTQGLDAADENSRRRHRPKCKPNDTEDNGDDAIPLTTSVERYITNLMDELCRIAVIDSDDQISSAQTVAGGERSSKNFTEILLPDDTAPPETAEPSTEPATAPPSAESFLTTTNIPLDAGASVGPPPVVKSFVVFTNIPPDTDTTTVTVTTMAPTPELPGQASAATFTNLSVPETFLSVKSRQSLQEAASTTASFLLSARNIVDLLLSDAIQGYESVADLGQATSADRPPAVTDPRSVDVAGLEARRSAVTQYASQLDGALTRLVQTDVSNIDTGMADAVQDLLGLLETNATILLELEGAGSASTASLVGKISQTTVQAATSLLVDLDRLAATALDGEERDVVAAELAQLEEEAGASVMEQMTAVAEVMAAALGSPSSVPVENEASDVGPAPQSKPEPPPQSPLVLSPTTLTTLQLLIHQLEEENKEIEHEQFSVLELQMRLLPRHFNLSYPPIAFSVDLDTVASSEYQLERTNIAGSVIEIK